MTPHDQISAYIDNELGMDQEQDFLISLASNDGLRKSFRSELVLKNVIHQDEVLTTPSRDMRGAVLATLGIVGASAIAADSSTAATAASATKTTFLKTMFASKLNALVTASMVTASALGGYAVRTIIAEKPATHEVSSPIIRSAQQAAPQTQVAAPVSTPLTDVSHESAPKTIAKHKIAPKENVITKTDTPVDQTSGTNGAVNKPPIMDSPKK